MATRRTTTGASSESKSTYMSSYDKECEKKFEDIEKRLDALEAKSHTPCGGGKSNSNVEERLEALIKFLKKDQRIPL